MMVRFSDFPIPAEGVRKGTKGGSAAPKTRKAGKMKGVKGLISGGVKGGKAKNSWGSTHPPKHLSRLKGLTGKISTFFCAF